MTNHRDRPSSSLISKIYAGCFYTVLLTYTVVFLLGRCFLPPQDEWCPHSASTAIRYANPDYDIHPCHKHRTPYLLYLHLRELEFGQRMLFSLLLGGIIGFERRASERPAGIRTMGMVCLGSCFFSMTSQLAFESSTMGWDASRVAAAVPSGVGFLGAGLIWKGSSASTREVDGKIVTTSSQEVHGLTTAASVWLSAAVGVAVGGGRRLYIVSVYGVALVILVLRFGPRMYFAKDSESAEEWDDEDDSMADWENFTDDSSDVLSQYDDGKGVNNELEFVETFLGGSGGSSPTKNVNVEPSQPTAAAATLNTLMKTQSKPLTRHASAPNLLASTYETPIIDHSDAKRGLRKALSIRKRRTPNVMKLSFHG